MASSSEKSPARSFGVGTVKGDIHDIGKNIVVTLLRNAGFKVTDLGVDVPADKFVEAIKETGAKVLGLSCSGPEEFDGAWPGITDALQPHADIVERYHAQAGQEPRPIGDGSFGTSSRSSRWNAKMRLGSSPSSSLINPPPP
jgi:hypothetical protein